MDAYLLDLLISKVERYARRRHISMLAAKDASESQDAMWAAVAAAHGLRRQPSLPTALLDLRFETLDGYLATLSRATRKDLRRKLQAAAPIRVEWRSSIDDIIDEVMRLYRATLAHAKLSFEELTPAFFTGTLREMGIPIWTPAPAICRGVPVRPTNEGSNRSSHRRSTLRASAPAARRVSSSP